MADQEGDTLKYVRVANWRTFQHYDPSKRTPPWIKQYTALLDASTHPTFADLSDHAKLVLHHVRLLAATIETEAEDEEPLIPFKWINSDRLNLKSRPRIHELVATGFLEIVDERASKLASKNASEPDSKDASKADSKPASKSPLARTALPFSEPLPSSAEPTRPDVTSPSPAAPDFEAVARVLPRFAQVGLRTTPTEQTLVGLVQTYGEAMILEALADKEPNLTGKSWQYVETVLRGWKENPNERPSNRKSTGKRSQNSTGTAPKRSAKDFGMRTLDDVLAAKRNV